LRLLAGSFPKLAGARTDLLSTSFPSNVVLEAALEHSNNVNQRNNDKRREREEDLSRRSKAASSLVERANSRFIPDLARFYGKGRLRIRRIRVKFASGEEAM